MIHKQFGLPIWFLALGLVFLVSLAWSTPVALDEAKNTDTDTQATMISDSSSDSTQNHPLQEEGSEAKEDDSASNGPTTEEKAKEAFKDEAYTHHGTPFQTADQFGFNGSISFNIGANLNPNSVRAVSDTGGVGFGFGFKFPIYDKDPANPEDMNVTFHTGLGFSTAMGTLMANGFTGNRLVVSGLFVNIQNFFAKGLTFWIGDRVRASDALYISGSRYNGDIAFMRGCGMDLRPQNKVTISLDFGGNWQARTSYRNANDGSEAVNEPVYNSAGLPEVLDYYAFIDDSNRERVRKIYTSRGRLEVPLGGNGYNQYTHLLGINTKLMLLDESPGNRYYDTPDHRYGTDKIRSEESEQYLGYNVGYPHETGYTFGLSFTSQAAIKEGVNFNNKLLFSYNRSLAVTGMGPGGMSYMFDTMIEYKTDKDRYPLVQSDRTINNMMNIIAGDAFIIQVRDVFRLVGELHALIMSNGVASTSAGGNGFFLGSAATYAFNDFLQLNGNVAYQITFPTAGARAAMLVKHLQRFTFNLSPKISLAGKQFDTNAIGLFFTGTWLSTGNIPRDPQTGRRITDKYGIWAHWQFALGVSTSVRW